MGVLRRNWQLLTFVLFLAAGLQGCSSSGAFEKDIRQDLNELRSVQADHTAKFEQMRSELRTLVGKLEELEYMAQGKTRELEQKLWKFGARVPPPPGVSETLLNQDEEYIASMQGEAADLYRNGLQSVRAGEFDTGLRVFSRFLEAKPDTAFSDNALYWIGVSYEKLGQYDRAIVSFSDVFQRFPGEDRVDDSLYRLAESFLKIGSPDDARLTLQKLLDEHPRSGYKKQARALLQKTKRRR